MVSDGFRSLALCLFHGGLGNGGTMPDFPTLMDFLVAEIVGNGLFGNVFDGVLFRYRIVQDEAAQVVGEVQKTV